MPSTYPAASSRSLLLRLLSPLPESIKRRRLQMVNEMNAGSIRLDPFIELFSALKFGDIQIHCDGGKQGYLLRVIHCLKFKVE